MSLLSPLLRTWRSLHRRVLLHRRALAALFAALAVLGALRATSPPPAPTETVWTASRDLAGGALLTAGDLARSRFAPGTVPHDAVTDLREVLGRRLAAPLTRGEPLTRIRTVAPTLLRGYPGTTAVPVRVGDADVVDLLRVGDRVSIVVADPEGRGTPTPLVSDVPVVAIPAVRNDAVATGAPGRLVVVAVPREDALEVAARADTGILIPVWDR